MNLLSLFFTSIRLANTVDRDRVRLNNDSEFKETVVKRLCDGGSTNRAGVKRALDYDFVPGHRDKIA